jgi:hypothetical protein
MCDDTAKGRMIPDGGINSNRGRISMPSNGSPNTVALQGLDAHGQVVYQEQLSLAQYPESSHLWDDPNFIHPLGIVRLIGDLFDVVGELEQHYEREYDAEGRYQGSTITYADGRSLTSRTLGLEPSTILHGELVFTVHYLRNTSNPQAANWFAFTLVLFDPDDRVYPAEYFQIPKEQQPPSIDGSGATHFEAYQEVRRKVAALEAGRLPKT